MMYWIVGKQYEMGVKVYTSTKKTTYIMYYHEGQKKCVTAMVAFWGFCKLKKKKKNWNGESGKIPLSPSHIFFISTKKDKWEITYVLL